MSYDFTGRTAIVSGAAHGLGRAIALALAQSGAVVYGLDVLADELEETGQLLANRGRVATVDATAEAQVDALVARVLAEQGGVQVLVNCAGGVDGQAGSRWRMCGARKWRRILRVNLYGTFHLTERWPRR